MLNEAMDTAINDPLHSVADALDAAVERGAGRNGGRKGEGIRLHCRLIASSLSGLTYKTCYAVSYGIVFPTILVVRAIPKENAVVQGVIDGARAAIELVR